MARRRSRHQTNTPRILAIVGVAAIAIVVVVMAAIALNPAPPPTASESRYSPRPASSDPEVVIPSIAFLGDSWAGGTGADPSGPRNGYPGLTAKALEWSNWEAFQGGGTGYTQGNEKGEGAFVSRVPAVIAYRPTVVIVQGSSNDLTSDYTTINAAATEVFAQLRAGLPDAKIYALGPIDSPASPLDDMEMARTAVRDAATAQGVDWIDGNSEGWLDLATDFADGFHPTTAGHQKVADHLSAIIREQ